MDNKGVNGAANTGNYFEAAGSNPFLTPENNAQMPMGQMSQEQMQAMMRAMQAQLDAMKANGGAEHAMPAPNMSGAEMAPNGETMQMPENPEEEVSLAQEMAMLEADKAGGVQMPEVAAPQTAVSRNDAVAKVKDALKDIPMKRDAENPAFVSKAMAEINPLWRDNPHAAVDAFNAARKLYCRGTFDRGLGGGE